MSEILVDSFEERVQRLKDLIDKSNHIVFFGGAGVSTESGIPDFRSADGLYNTHDVNFEGYEPEYLLSSSCLDTEPEVFFEFYRQKLDARNVMPNITHYKLVELEKSGKLKAIVTQNIDGLHQKAGSNPDIVFEIHGTTTKNYCEFCRKEYPSDYIFNSTEKVPKCECGGIIRPRVTLYGEQLPLFATEQAYLEIRNADLIIVAGTSLTVYPANSFLNARNKDCKIVILNRDSTQLDEEADLIFRENMGEVMKLL